MASLIGKSSLYNLCLESVAKLLKNNLWDTRYEFSNRYDNPFAQVPSAIIDELIVSVVRLSKTNSLRNTDLYHLIATGQVSNFPLKDIKINIDDILHILIQLPSKCQNLISFKLTLESDSRIVLDRCTTSDKIKNSLSRALECVLTSAPLLEYVETFIEFDLKCLRNAEYLKQLRLKFLPKSHLFDFLKETNGQICPNNSLKKLEILQYKGHTPPYLDIAVILKHCNELVETNCDIAKSLEHLHLAELQNGTLTSQYKLEKCSLFTTFKFNDCVTGDPIRRLIVSLAEITCPNLREIDVAFIKDSLICSLSNFPYLTSLTTEWRSPVAGNFQLGTTSLLEKIGPNLKKIHILMFEKVDFSTIGNLCPKLEELRVEYSTDCRRSEFSPISYRNLKKLRLVNVSHSFNQSDFLVCVLSQCINLEHLSIIPAEEITDTILKRILDKNNFSNLKEAHMVGTHLSVYGIELLAAKATLLEVLCITSYEVLFGEIVAAVRKFKPRVKWYGYNFFRLFFC